MFRILFYAAVIYMLLGIRVVKSREWMAVFRSGKYSGYRKEGLHWVVPFVDKTVRIELDEISPNWKEVPDEILETEVHKRAADLLSS